MQNSPKPIFIRANFTFELIDRDYNFLNHAVSVFGISGLRWPHFDPTGFVGQQVKVTVDVLAQQRFRFTTDALITAELTTDAVYLGARFYPGDGDKRRLAEAISREGFYPTNYLRKFPRIPAWPTISNVPLRTVVKAEFDELVVFDIANISPNGILLLSENPKAAEYYAGSRLHAQVEPRGEPFKPFTFDGQVCRVLMDKNPSSGNINRYLGIRMLRIPDDEKTNFLEILQAVLHKMKS